MEKALQMFEGLIRRSIAPSVTFFVMAIFVDLTLAKLAESSSETKNVLTEWIAAMGTAPWGAWVAIVLFWVLGVSYGLATLQQVIFDNRLKDNFDPWFGPKWLSVIPRWLGLLKSADSELRALTELRGKVVQKLRAEPALVGLGDLERPSDFVLYEILGGIDPTNTRPYVDAAKAVGITCISMILALAVGLLVHWSAMCWTLRSIFLALALTVYVLGHGAIKAQFRARALRLYVNFLMMPSERIWRILLGLEKKNQGQEKKDKKDTKEAKDP